MKPYLLILLTLILVFGLFRSPLFTIRAITCTYHQLATCPDNIQVELNKYLHQNLLLTDYQTLKQRLKNILVDTKQIDINFLPHNTVNFTFTPLKSIATVKTSSSSAALTVLENYRLIEPQSTEHISLPQLILYNQSIRANDTFTDETIIFSLNLLNQLTSLGVKVDTCNLINPDFIKITLKDHTTLLFSSLVDLSRQVTSLQAILSTATMTTDSRIIDLRFEKPVLKPS